jgi:hypothetical protein
MPLKAGDVRKQPDVLKGLIRVGAMEGFVSLVNFAQKKRTNSTVVQFVEVELDQTDPAPVPEGSAFNPASPNSRTTYNNATQIFKKDYQITATALAVTPDTKEDVVAEEKLQAMRELNLKLAKALASANAPQLTDPRRMGGLAHFAQHTASYDVPTGEDLELHAEDLRKAIIEASLEIAKKGGVPNMIAMGAPLKVAFNAMGGSATRFFDVNKNELNNVINVYHGEFGVIYGYYDIGIGTDERAIVFKKEDLKLMELRPFKTVKLGARGDAVDFEIVGEYSLACAPNHTAVITVNRT